MRASIDHHISTLVNNIKSYGSRPVIPILKIRGNINARLTYDIAKALTEVPTRNVKFLAVIINSAGGCPGQCHIISKKFEIFSNQTKIPVYTFAEDQATSGGYFLLSCGEKVFADGASMIGGIGAVHRHLNISRALADWDVYIEKYATSEKSLDNQLSWMEEFNDDTRTKVHKILQGTHKKFIEHVESKRGEKLQGDEQEKERNIFDGNVFLGGKAKDLGLVDEVVNYSEYFNVHYPNAKILNVTRVGMLDKIRSVASKFITISSDIHMLKVWTKTYLK